MTQKLVSFIISGGVGSRLWPLSREDFPKQFHDFSGQGSMLSRTIQRMNARPQSPVFLIASEAHEGRLRQDIAGFDLNGGRPVFEPQGRNTAAAVALATLVTIADYGEDALILIVPSDHEISTNDYFWATVETGVPAAKAGRIVVFGVHPDKPETGYGYIETGAQENGVFNVLRFVEKPDLKTAESYITSGRFLWNAGIFLFSAKTMREAFLSHAPDIWRATKAAFQTARTDVSGTWLSFDAYAAIPSDSVDYAIMEHAQNVALVPARFHWNDLGSWQSLLEAQGENNNRDENGNVIIGDVVAINCERSYLRSEGGLLSAVGLKNVAVVATTDATFVAPVSQSQNVRDVVRKLEQSGRLEAKFTPAPDRLPVAGAYAKRVHHWLMEETLPLWSTRGVDDKGGFFEALDFSGKPLPYPRRMRTMARQIYAFAIAGERGWGGPSMQLIDHGIDFITRFGRTENGGWAAVLDDKGQVLDATEDCYDTSFILLALAYAHRAGNKKALSLATETLAFLDEHLADKDSGGFFETTAPTKGQPRRANPHMHLLEAFLAWHSATGDRAFLQRAGRIIDLCKHHFFDADTWTLGEFFDDNWQPLPGLQGELCEPGHHFEWASLIVNYADETGEEKLVHMARKLYASAIANGLNRATGLAYNSITKLGLPQDRNSRSWPQTEAVKAAIALDCHAGPDLKPEIEARVGRLFRWHIDAAPTGLWIDLIDEQGRAKAKDVPASIFYHLVAALTRYMDFASTCQKGH